MHEVHNHILSMLKDREKGYQSRPRGIFYFVKVSVNPVE